MLVALLLLACSGGGEAEATKDWGARRPSQQVRYEVEMALDPAEPALGELLMARATVYLRTGEVVPNANVTLDARMPQHEHGMETRPIPRPGACPPEGGRCLFADGIYEADGFKFHMAGAWTLNVDIDGPNGRDNASFIYVAK